MERHVVIRANAEVVVYHAFAQREGVIESGALQFRVEPVVALNDAKGETSSTVSIRSASSLAYRRHWMRALLFSKMSAPGFLNSMMTSLLAFRSSS